MKVQLESTEKIVRLNGVPARLWEGNTESGVAVHAYIVRVAVKEGQPAECYVQFERELRECRPPSADIAAIPLSLIL